MAATPDPFILAEFQAAALSDPKPYIERDRLAKAEQLIRRGGSLLRTVQEVYAELKVRPRPVNRDDLERLPPIDAGDAGGFRLSGFNLTPILLFGGLALGAVVIIGAMRG